ncbi:hypothetical protein JCM8097_008171 [Rhodosporidiobolus ruineniae]
MSRPPDQLEPPSHLSSSAASTRDDTVSTSSTHSPLVPGQVGDPTDVVKAAPGESERVGGERDSSSPALRWAKRILGFLIDQWFIIGIGVVIALASQFPNVARPHGVLKAQWTIKYLAVGIIFLISGLSLPLRNLYIGAGRWQLHLVCHITSFLIFPAIVFAIVSAVRASDPTYETFNRWLLVGMVVMGVMPTTVSSNVVMTKTAGGDEAATTIEVMLGNLVGTFLTPALLELFLSDSSWSFGKPVASGGGGLRNLYAQVSAQLGYSVFIPLFVGEVIQYIFPKPVKWAVVNLKLGKVGTFCLLLVIWSSFSQSFYEGAFDRLTGNAVAFVVCTNLFLYILFTLFLFAICRLITFPYFAVENRKLVKTGAGPLFSPEITISALFTGAAKGAALGAPIVSILYGGLDGEAQGIVGLPLVLYQGSQVVVGQVTVAVLKAWAVRKKRQAAVEAGEAPGRGAAAA